MFGPLHASKCAVAARALVSLALLFGACGDSEPPGDVGSTAAPPAPPCVPELEALQAPSRCAPAGEPMSGLPVCEQWTLIEVPDAVCGNGSPYRFFASYSGTSDNLVIMFEPGGACWDYESCTGAARGAANPGGIPDDHMTNYQFLNLLRRTDDNPVRDWNMVFIPYCTGDVHAGDEVATYPDPTGGPALTYRHVGLANTSEVIVALRDSFENVPQLLVTGCSAGGIGALQNYASIREGLPGVQCGYLLNDSGPAFHDDGPSKALHAKVRAAWNLDTLFEQLSSQLDVELAELIEDTGVLSPALADRYPSDRFGLTLYRKDLNYSLYSYERFFPGSTPEDIHAMWERELRTLLRTYDTRPNLAYYVPYFRSDNCSHCVSIPPLGHDTRTILEEPWLGSEIAADGLDLRDFVARLLDDTQPLESHLEKPVPEEDFTAEELAMCLDPAP